MTAGPCADPRCTHDAANHVRDGRCTVFVEGLGACPCRRYRTHATALPEAEPDRERWEKVLGHALCRHPVPGGWVYRAEGVYGSVGITFVPDPEITRETILEVVREALRAGELDPELFEVRR